jgi:hexosaminidase
VAYYSQLACDGHTHKPVTSVSPAFDSLCTSKTSTYTFVDAAVATIAAATPGPYLHVGGDEASALSQQQYNGFVAKAQKSVAAQHKTPIAWAEMASGPIAPGTVAEFWNTGGKEPYIAAAASHGTKFILAPGTHAYLDQQPVPTFPLGLHWAGYTPVSKAYDWDPATLLHGVSESSVLGVEATLFTETVRSLDDAETLAFPRLPAIAEIGWSPERTHAWDGFSARLAKQGPLWDKLGITYYKSPEVTWP